MSTSRRSILRIKAGLKSITDSQWHLIVAEHDPAELYDWPDDLAETRNVVESIEGKTVAAEFNTKLWNQLSPAGHTKADVNSPIETQSAGHRWPVRA